MKISTYIYSMVYTVANDSFTDDEMNDSPHVLRSKKDELFVQIVLRMVQHQLHADSTIQHVLHIQVNSAHNYMYTCILPPNTT